MYQRAMVTLFYDMMHKEVEVYYRLRLNPAKCTFGVKTGKLLGFIVNERGIELDLDKVKAIRNMPAYKTEIEVRANSHLQLYIQNPLEESEDEVEPRMLRGLQKVLEESMGGILGQRATSKKEHAIYYLSKKFTKCEKRYSTFEQTCCALVWAAKRLRQNMLARTTWLIAKMDPLKYSFGKTRQIAC
ncbi:hypothetical protein CR513_50610, partial [Mucuna pruriens]